MQGLGQRYATIASHAFTFWCYITPVMGAIVAEQYLGRVKTIKYASMIYCCGLITLFLSSLDFARESRISLFGLVLSLFLIGIESGGIKSNVGPLIAEQYVDPVLVIRLLKSGERVIVDKSLTIERFVLLLQRNSGLDILMLRSRIFTTFTFFINIGSCTASIMTVVEKNYGFSITFAIPMMVYLTALLVLLATQRQYINRTPRDPVLLRFIRALPTAFMHKDGVGNWESPIYTSGESTNDRNVYDAAFIDAMRKALRASKVFLLYPLYWAAYSQSRTNLVSQAATMETYRIPNDMIAYLNPIIMLILLPVLNRIIFPLLRSMNVSVTYNNRMLAGFLFCGVAMVYSAFLQWAIYAAPPCYDHPRAQECSNGSTPNKISVFLQIPAYILIAISEALAAVAGLEYAYAKSPQSLRSLTMSIYLSTVSLGALLAMAFSPLMTDPNLTWMYLTLGVETFIGGAILQLVLRSQGSDQEI